MSYESATYVNQLDKNLPRGSDSVSEGDIHLRTIKEVLKNSFPNVDTPVNAIHTTDTEPALHSAGTVWFDTSSGLVKLRNADDTLWINMGHGAATGLGALLRVNWYEWGGGGSFRNGESIVLKDWTVTPLSPNSSMIITVSADVAVWGYSSEQSLRAKLVDVTTGVDITQEHLVVGYQHIDDVGNFETKTQMNLRARYNNHPAGAFELGLSCRCTRPEEGGYGMERVIVQCDELE